MCRTLLEVAQTFPHGVYFVCSIIIHVFKALLMLFVPACVFLNIVRDLLILLTFLGNMLVIDVQCC